MVLKLKQIRLTNWRCYQDEVINLNLDTDRNVWIIFGQNGYGKTSLLEAVTSCLYSGEAVPHRKLVDSFNTVEVSKNPDLELAVQITFKDNNTIYQISRVAKRKPKGNNLSAEVQEAIFRINGEEKGDSRERIEYLLPKSCRDFFFFDGVEIERYAEMTETKATHEAIEKILGIPELKNLRDDAKKALATINANLYEVSLANKELKEVNHSFFETQDKLDIYRGQLKEAKEQHQASISLLEDIKKRASQIEDLQGKLDELSRLQQKQQRLQEELQQ